MKLTLKKTPYDSLNATFQILQNWLIYQIYHPDWIIEN